MVRRRARRRRRRILNNINNRSLLRRLLIAMGLEVIMLYSRHIFCACICENSTRSSKKRRLLSMAVARSASSAARIELLVRTSVLWLVNSLQCMLDNE